MVITNYVPLLEFPIASELTILEMLVATIQRNVTGVDSKKPLADI